MAIFGSKLATSLDGVEEEERRLNAAKDEIDKKIAQNRSAPAAVDELQAAIARKLAAGAEAFRKNLQARTKSLDPEKIEILKPSFSHLANDIALLRDAVGYLLFLSAGAVARDVAAVAPKGGITKAARTATEEKLMHERHTLETELEGLYRKLESWGATPARRPDLSPEVFLDFKSKETWNRAALDSLRERIAAKQSTRSRLEEKRSANLSEQAELRRRRDELERQLRNSGLSAKIREDIEREKAAIENRVETLKTEEKALSDKIDAVDAEHTMDNRLFNRCLEFLRDNGIQVDHRL